MKGLVIDMFAGCGGASIGIESALGRPIDVAINHSETALAVHSVNHPETLHLRGDVWSYAPRDVTGGKPVSLLWASPTCTFFSRAKGGPLDVGEARKVRALAWVANRWAKDVRPDTIIVENVEAFKFWGPLLRDGKACQRRRGATFRKWVREIERAGYSVEWRELSACDYGAPTTRKRLFVVARLGAQPEWPDPTHGPGLLPYRAASECIDWTIPCPSIFGRKRPLADATLRRIARGMHRFVLSGNTYFVGGDLAATLIQRGYGERKGQEPRCLDIQKPLGTVVAGGVKHALVVAFIAKHFGGNESPGQALTSPLGTVTCKDHHALVIASSLGDRTGKVKALLERFGGSAPLSLFSPRFEIRDIGMRWLTARELASAQGFPSDYALDRGPDGERFGVTEQVRLVGNSVSPPLARHIVEANIKSKVIAA